MDFNLIILFDFLALVQGVLLGLLLVLFSNKQRPSLFLGLFLITYSLDLLSSILDDLDVTSSKPEFLFLHLHFYYLSAVLFFYYCKQIIGRFSFKKDFWYSLPGIFEMVFFAMLFLQPTDSKVEINNAEFWNILIDLIDLGGLLYSSVMMVLTLRLIKKNRAEVVNFYSYSIGKTLNWLKWTAIILLSFAGLVILFDMIDNTVVNEMGYAVISAINVIIIFWVGLSGFKQQIIFKSLNMVYRINPDKKLLTSKSQDQREDEEDYAHLVNYMRESTCFTNPKLQLSELAEEVNITPRRLSMLINQKAAMNFNQFINQYRVDKVKEMLNSRKFNHYTMLGIANEVGFNSKTSFYNAFKEFVQTTPQQYKKQAQASSITAKVN